MDVISDASYFCSKFHINKGHFDRNSIQFNLNNCSNSRIQSFESFQTKAIGKNYLMYNDI